MKKTKFQKLLEHVPEETKRLVYKQDEIAAQIDTLLKQKGFMVIFVFFTFYLIRDAILYLLIPYLVIKGIL